MAALKCSSAGWNGSLMHIWQIAPNNGWSDWDGLGVPHPEFRSPDGRFVYGMLATAPSVNRNADGRLEVFGVRLRDSFHSDLVHIWQPAPSSGPWSSWASLGGELKFVSPATVRNADGRLEVFACTRDMPSGTFGKQRPITAGLIGSHLAVEWWAHRSP